MSVTAIAASIVALALACTIPEVDLEGRPCPCIDGYTCNAVTNRCESGTGIDAGRRPDASSLPDRGSTDAGGTPDSGTSDAGTCFFDGFDDGDLAGWNVNGGSWSVVAGEAQQADTSVGLSFIYAEATAGFTDYRLRSRFRLLSDSGVGAIELDFRVDPDAPNAQYFCNWEPVREIFLVMRQNAFGDTVVLDEVFIDTTAIPGYDVDAPLTMNVEIEGEIIHCWIEEIPQADLSVSDDTRASGAAGFKTYAISAAYDFIEVCPL